jgi:hypothetical protein
MTRRKKRLVIGVVAVLSLLGAIQGIRSLILEPRAALVREIGFAQAHRALLEAVQGREVSAQKS